MTAVGRRLAAVMPTVLAMTLVTYALARLAPGEPWWGDLEASAPGAIAQHVEVGVVEGYVLWLRDVAQLELGRSLVDRRPVQTRIAEALPVTLGLTVSALVLTWLIAMPLGVWLAQRPSHRGARIFARVLSGVAGLPSAWVALLAVWLLASDAGVPLFPRFGVRSADGRLPIGLDVAWHLVLPVACLALGLIAVTARQVESAVAEALRSAAVFGARARGVPERRVVWRHAVPNAALPVMTLFGLQLAHVLSGSAVFERAFGLPGIGSLALEAALARDYPVVMGVATLVSIATVLAMALVDVAVVALDPRLRGEGRS